jgi:hypothetical protein
MERHVSCYGCGALVRDLPGLPHPYIGAVAGCWEVYGEILAREYGDYGYPVRPHRLTVDTYAVQHPGTPGRQSIQSVNGHLVSLYLVLERGMEGAQATAALARVLRHADQFTWLAPPTPNGRLTVLDVVRAADAAEHAALVEQWAREVWAAWAPHHPTIRGYVARYLGW